MSFHPFEVTTPHIIYALLGGFIVLFGMFSLFLRSKLYVGEAVWAFIFGIVIGPYAADVFNPRAWSGNNEEVTNVITLEFTRIVLAIGVFAIGVELPKAYMAKHWKSLFYLLVPVMTWGWFISAAFIYGLIPGLNFLSSLAVAACLTPTDPILAQAVIGGKWADKHVPAHIRHLLAAESGCNDGAAFPFLFIALYLIIDSSTGAAVRDWFLILWLYQVVLGAVIGSILGFSFRHLMKFCQRHDLIDRHSYVAQYISLAILTIGVTTLLGSDDLLSTFFCGTAFAWDGFFNQQTEESVFSSVIDTLFNVAAFIFVGAWMPFDAFQNAATTVTVWRLIAIAILVLLFRRLPIMIICYKWIPDIKTFREAVFCGHFGPIGIGGVFISTLAVEVLHDAHLSEENHQAELLKETIQPIVAFMVLCSIVIHGLSVPSFSLGRRVHSVSRTWSRRDTTGSQGPEWANQARMVTRGEDIVINRDRPGSEVDLEVGDSGGSSSSYLAQKLASQEKHRLQHPDQKPFSEKHAAGDEESVGSADIQLMGDSNLTDETRVQQASGKATRDHSPLPPSREDSREEVPPDGRETLMEWIEGNHKVIERRTGPGDDVEVTVVPLDSNVPESHAMTRTISGKIHQLENEIRPSIKRELASLSAKAGQALEALSPTPSSFAGGHKRDDSGAQLEPPSVVISGDDDGDEGWASEGSEDDVHDASGTKKSRKASRATGVHHVTSQSGRKARRPMRRGSMSTSTSTPAVSPGLDDTEPLRGRPEGRSRERDNSVTFAQTERRPHTSHGSSGNRAPRVGEGIPPSRSRPLTADSGARHHRLESIRAMHASSPPTRESSPSRSIRFVDTESGRSGTVNSNTLVVSGGGRPTSRSASPLPPAGDRKATD